MEFVEATDSQQSPPAFRFPGVTINSFVMHADMTALQAWCDAFLNNDPRHWFRALAPFAYLCVSHYPRMILVDYENYGYATQNEYFFMFPVLRHDALGNFLLPRELTWAMPVIGVDNPSSAIAGQTVLGFPKMSGVITRGQTTAGGFVADIAMPGFRVFKADSAQEMLPIIRAETGAALTGVAAPGPRGFPWSLLDQQNLVGGLENFLLEMLELLDPGVFSATSLKQFRNAAAPARAAYASLVRSEWRLSNTGAPTFLDNPVVDVFDNPVLPLTTMLGLTGGTPYGTGQRFQPLAAFSMQTDMWFGDCREINPQIDRTGLPY